MDAMKQPGFRATRIAEGLFRIWEGDAVSMFLVTGQEKALLVDSGYGVGDLPAFLTTLTDRPIILANTHGHIDHTGGNHAFGEAYMHPADFALANRHASPDERERAAAYLGIPGAGYREKGLSRLVPLEPGHRFDLGGRSVEAVACAGHTTGSLAFFDHATGSMLVGDAVSRHVWLFDDDSSTLPAYSASLQALQGYPIRSLYCSHAPECFGPGFIDELIGFTARVCVEKSRVFPVPLANTNALIYHEGGELFASPDFFSLVFREEKLGLSVRISR